MSTIDYSNEKKLVHTSLEIVDLRCLRMFNLYTVGAHSPLDKCGAFRKDEDYRLLTEVLNSFDQSSDTVKSVIIDCSGITDMGVAARIVSLQSILQLLSPKMMVALLGLNPTLELALTYAWREVAVALLPVSVVEDREGLRFGGWLGAEYFKHQTVDSNREKDEQLWNELLEFREGDYQKIRKYWTRALIERLISNNSEKAVTDDECGPYVVPPGLKVTHRIDLSHVLQNHLEAFYVAYEIAYYLTDGFLASELNFDTVVTHSWTSSALGALVSWILAKDLFSIDISGTQDTSNYHEPFRQVEGKKCVALIDCTYSWYEANVIRNVVEQLGGSIKRMCIVVDLGPVPFLRDNNISLYKSSCELVN